jgi:eukaryotic-like serine/threonine-protein kinase
MGLFDVVLKPGGRVGGFRLERRLGEGAFGEVWLAVDEGSHGFSKRVALKILSHRHGRDRVDGLLREARLTAHFNHPNVIDVLGVGQYRGVSFIVMEYIVGQTLAAFRDELLARGQPWPHRLILEVGISIAEALHHAWVALDARGEPLRVVHRDLKPENVMLSEHGAVVVGDFGVAEAGFDSPEERRKARGTPRYMPPEAWLGESGLTPAADLFSLGVILWELVTDCRFFEGVEDDDIIDALVDRSPEEETASIAAIFPSLASQLGRLLRRRPEERPQDALDVACELRRIRDRLAGSGDLVRFVRSAAVGDAGPAGTGPGQPGDADTGG